MQHLVNPTATLYGCVEWWDTGPAFNRTRLARAIISHVCSCVDALRVVCDFRAFARNLQAAAE
eukprot:SAG11_NODE_37815_length_255_cov_0.660256_1_plen_62_part_01